MRRVALVGSPNAGKTSVFNHLTGLRAKTGNYPGVTCSTGRVSSSRSLASVANISYWSSCVLDDVALRAEVDCPVIGRDCGLDDVAVAQIFRVFCLR